MRLTFCSIFENIEYSFKKKKIIIIKMFIVFDMNLRNFRHHQTRLSMDQNDRESCWYTKLKHNYYNGALMGENNVHGRYSTFSMPYQTLKLTRVRRNYRLWRHSLGNKPKVEQRTVQVWDNFKFMFVGLCGCACIGWGRARFPAAVVIGTIRMRFLCSRQMSPPIFSSVY